MATLAVPHTFSSGQTPSAAQFNANFDEIEDFINDGDADTNNISTKYADLVWSFHLDTVAGGNTTAQIRFKIPTGVTVIWVEAQLGVMSGSGTASLNFTSDGDTVLSTPITGSGGSTVIQTASGWSPTTSAAGDEIVITVSEIHSTPNSVTDVQVTLYGKTLLRT
jgi:hypothetical protein